MFDISPSDIRIPTRQERAERLARLGIGSSYPPSQMTPPVASVSPAIAISKKEVAHVDLTEKKPPPWRRHVPLSAKVSFLIDGGMDLMEVSRRLGIDRGELTNLVASIEANRNFQLSKWNVTADACRYIQVLFRVTDDEMMSSRRAPRFVVPRQIGMWVASSYTRLSLPAIGRRFAGRDHTTVLHAARKINAILAKHGKSRADFPDWRDAVDALHEIMT